MQVDSLILERALQAFAQDVVPASALAVHGDGDLGAHEYAGELMAGGLGSWFIVKRLRVKTKGIDPDK